MYEDVNWLAVGGEKERVCRISYSASSYVSDPERDDLENNLKKRRPFDLWLPGLPLPVECTYRATPQEAPIASKHMCFAL